MMRAQLLLGQSLVPLHYLALKSVHYNKTHLPIWLTLSLVYIFEMRKYNFWANDFQKMLCRNYKEKRT